MTRGVRIGVSILAGTVLFVAGASAQNIGDTGGSAPSTPDTGNAPSGGTAPSGGGQMGPSDTGSQGAPSQPSVTTTYRTFGLPSPGTDINPGLPSSSRPTLDASR